MKSRKAQSFIEFALVLPVLILMVMGVVELALFIGAYINVVDLTREAARFASMRDPFDAASQGDNNCSTTNSFNFYYDTACIFSALEGSATCSDAAFCNGFNSTLLIKPAEDDILISVFTVTGNQISNQWPATNTPYVWSSHDADTAHNENWRRDCDRQSTPQTMTPYFNTARMNSYLPTIPAPPGANTPTPVLSTNNKGFVVVETYFCYHQALNTPFLAQFIPNPLLIHTYTVMPLPAAQPTPTPRPTRTP